MRRVSNDVFFLMLKPSRYLSFPPQAQNPKVHWCVQPAKVTTVLSRMPNIYPILVNLSTCYNWCLGMDVEGRGRCHLRRYQSIYLGTEEDHKKH
jgi:hypothetical protein